MKVVTRLQQLKYNLSSTYISLNFNMIKMFIIYVVFKSPTFPKTKSISIDLTLEPVHEYDMMLSVHL